VQESQYVLIIVIKAVNGKQLD